MLPRVVFFGSPDFAIPSLKAVCARYPVVAVVTQPDRPSGRGKLIQPPPVKVCAGELGLPVLQPEKLREPVFFEQLASLKANLFVVAAFGQIFRKNILDLPEYGLINVHASLLPRWRGAAPIQAAILAGDHQTGVSIMKLDEGIDTGNVLDMASVDIKPGETAGELSSRLADLGAQLLVDTLPGYLDGRLQPVAQPQNGATYAGMIIKEDALLDLRSSAEQLTRKVLAYNPWPLARINDNDETYIIHRAHTHNGKPQQESGARVVVNNLPGFIATDGILAIDSIQVPGRKVIDGRAFIAGNRNWLKSSS